MLDGSAPAALWTVSARSPAACAPRFTGELGPARRPVSICPDLLAFSRRSGSRAGGTALAPTRRMRSSRASALPLLPVVLPLLSLLLSAFAAERARAEAPRWSWQPSSLVPGLSQVSALACDPRTGRLAVGDEEGVWLAKREARATRVLRRGPVRDLAFAPDAGLYAATDRGLFHVDAEGAVSIQSLGTGTGAVLRILVGQDLLLVGTEGGAFFAREGQRWSPLDAGLPGGAVSAFALRRLADGADLWLIVRGAVYRATLRTGAGRLAVEKAVRVSIPGARARRDAVDLSTSIPGAEIAVLTRRGLLLYRAGSWESFRPALPPGASPVRFGHTGSRLWMATDRGLLEAASPSGPWRRSAPPVGSSPIAALAGAEPLLYAAGDRGLFIARVEPEAAPPAAALPAPEAREADEPSVLQVQMAAIRHLDLAPERVRALQRGLRRRGWLPTFELRGAYGGGRRRQHDYDEAYTYDAARLFFDRQEERSRDFAVSTLLAWDLGDLAYHPESIDLSKEAREIIELRDDVLDEVTQLYFERQRALLELASEPTPPADEAARLRLRADELAAGLDAWTGGWWSRARSGSNSPRDTPEENHP